MAKTTQKMQLRVWDLTTDAYDHDQMAGNWYRLDRHDHTGTRGVQIPTDGIADGAVTAAKLAPGANSIGPGQVGLINLGSDVTTDYGYAYTTWRTILSGAAYGIGTTSTGNRLANPTAIGPGSGIGSQQPFNGSTLFYWDPSTYTAGSRTPYLRLRSWINTNQVAPTPTITVTLYSASFTPATSNNFNTYAAGGIVAGSASVIYSALAASTEYVHLSVGSPADPSGEFPAPVAGLYAVVISASATLNTGATLDAGFNLQVHQR